MKKLSYILSFVAVALFTAVSCEKEVAPIDPAANPAEVANCYGVFFPAQDASGDHTYSPVDNPVIEITVGRTNDADAITVPVKATYSEDGIFVPEDITFAAGQKETTFKVDFSKAAEGTKYSASFVIEDPQYASLYNSNPIAIDFSIMRVEMKDFMTEDGSKKAMITFSDDVFWGEVHDDVYLQYYEVDGIRYCETTGGKLVSPLDGGTEGVGPWGTGVQLKFKWYTKVQMAIGEDNFDFIEVEPQYHGWDNANRNSQVWFADYYNYYQANASTPYDGDAIKFFTNNGENYPPCYYDGHGGFIFNLAYYMPTSGGYWYGFNLKAPVGIAEGYVRVDYSFKAETDYSADGATPVFLEAGVDVASIKYAIYEGELTPTQVGNKVAAITDGTDASTEFTEFEEDEEGKFATLQLSPETTGLYTFVAVAYDAKKEAQNSASVVFKHIAAGDVEEHAVDVSVFTEDTPARYTSYHKYDSFAYGVAGTDLTDVHVAIFKFDDVAADSETYFNAVKADAKGTYALSAEDLAAVNGEGGFYTVATGMPAKTKLIVLVWATNGDMEDWVYATYTTDKLPYVWNSLGKGTLTDGFLMPVFGEDDVTLTTDVYEEATTPGLYMVTGFQLELCAAFYGMSMEELEPYGGEGSNWWNAQIVVDATDPAAVYIGEQDYGIYVNSTYGYVQIDSEPTGTLENGVITFPAKNMYLGLTNYGWLYGNSNGTFKITLPSAGASAPVLNSVSNGAKTNFVLARDAREYAKPVVKFERDPQPVKVAAQVNYTRKEKTAKSEMTISNVR